MFGIGLTELFLVFVIALLVIGPKRMPDFAKRLGQVITQLSETSRQFYAALTDSATKQGDATDQPPGWFSDVARPGSSVKTEKPDQNEQSDQSKK